METKNIILSLMITGMCFSCKQKIPQLGKDPVADVLAAMTLDEKSTIIIGTGMAGFTGYNAVVGESSSIIPGAAGTTHAIPRLAITPVVLADGPAGVRIAPRREGSQKTYYATAFPVATLLASSWNAKLVEDVGRVMGNEALEYGIDVLLAPGINIHRNPLCGRNFEYYSEDPVLSGRIAEAMIIGIQSNGVGASIKHFVANNQETNRTSSDSRVTQRALREIYLKGFEIGIKKSEPLTVMSAYNFINGVYAAENRELLTTILRDEWDFKGIVMTDWFGGETSKRMIHAGNDLLMPGLVSQKEDIMEAVNNGTLDIKYLDTCVARILEFIVKSPRFKGYKYSESPNLDTHAAIARESAAEGMILLKNANSALPLAVNVKKIAAYGVTSYDFISGGAGSGDVNSAYTVSLVQGLENAGYRLDADLRTGYEKYLEDVKKMNALKPKSDDILASHTAQARPDEFIPEPGQLNIQANKADVAMITIGRVSGEFIDRRIDGDFNLTEKEQKLIDAVSKAFHAKNKKVVVILNIGGVVETYSWKGKPDAILLAWQGGQEGGNSVADVLSGKVNPSGKLTMTFPIDYKDVSSALNFPFDHVVSGSLTESMLARNSRENLIRNIDYTLYEEDIFVGYRYFDSFNKPVSYPFGYGMTYTGFEYSEPSVKEANEVYTISIKIKNTGKMNGKEVVQLYVSAPVNPKYDKPDKELKAFAKTKDLKPGESQTLEMTVTKYDLASFDEESGAWVTDAGTYKFLTGSSSRSVKASLEVSIADKAVYKVNDVLRPREPINVLRRSNQ